MAQKLGKSEVKPTVFLQLRARACEESAREDAQRLRPAATQTAGRAEEKRGKELLNRTAAWLLLVIGAETPDIMAAALERSVTA